jgi:hypothetical protein
MISMVLGLAWASSPSLGGLDDLAEMMPSNGAMVDSRPSFLWSAARGVEEYVVYVVPIALRLDAPKNRDAEAGAFGSAAIAQWRPAKPLRPGQYRWTVTPLRQGRPVTPMEEAQWATFIVR